MRLASFRVSCVLFPFETSLVREMSAIGLSGILNLPINDCRGATRAAADLFFANRELLACSKHRSEVAAVLLVFAVYY